MPNARVGAGNQITSVCSSSRARASNAEAVCLSVKVCQSRPTSRWRHLAVISSLRRFANDPTPIQKPIEIPLALPMEVGGGDDDLARPPCPNRTGERRRLARSGRWPLRLRAAGSRHSQLNDPRPDLTAIHSAIKERVRSIGGALAIESALGQGARVEVWVSREAHG